MSCNRKIICLANSVKRFPNRCIAGKTSEEHHWLRPVTGDRHSEGAIPRTMTICTDRTGAEVLDIIEIPLIQHKPQHCQTENYLVATGTWVKHGRLGWNGLPELVDNQFNLWGTGRSSRYGFNDEITSQDAVLLTDSLRLLRPTDFMLHIREEAVYASDRTKKSLRGSFTHYGRRYLLKVTDPTWMERVNQLEVGQDIPIKEVFITVSVSDEFRGMHYKLIAAIITQDRC